MTNTVIRRWFVDDDLPSVPFTLDEDSSPRVFLVGSSHLAPLWGTIGSVGTGVPSTFVGDEDGGPRVFLMKQGHLMPLWGALGSIGGSVPTPLVGVPLRTTMGMGR